MPTNLDTGIAIAPATRPSAFTPPVAVAITPSNDATIAITPSARPDVFDDTTGATVTVNPGGSL